MTRLVMLVLVLLGYLVGRAEALDGEATGRFSLEVVGLVVTAFLFYVAFSGVIMARFSRGLLRKRKVAEHRGLSEVTGAPVRPADASRMALKARRRRG